MTAAQWLGLAVQASIMLTVMGLGLSAKWSDATFLFRRPPLLLRAFLSMNVAMPIIVGIIAAVVPMPFQLQIALVALAVSPVPPILQKKQVGAGGRLEYAIGLLVAMSLIAIVMVPLAVHIFDLVFARTGIVTPLAVAKIMLVSVFAPLAVGLAVHRYLPAAEKASSAVMAIGTIVLVVAVGVLIWRLLPFVKVFLGNGVVLIMVVVALIGLAVGHLLGGPKSGDRVALALATSSRHPAVALAIATSGTQTETRVELAIILLYLVVATIIAIPYQKWRSRVAPPQHDA